MLLQYGIRFALMTIIKKRALIDSVNFMVSLLSTDQAEAMPHHQDAFYSFSYALPPFSSICFELFSFQRQAARIHRQWGSSLRGRTASRPRMPIFLIDPSLRLNRKRSSPSTQNTTAPLFPRNISNLIFSLACIWSTLGGKELARSIVSERTQLLAVWLPCFQSDICAPFNKSNRKLPSAELANNGALLRLASRGSSR